MPTDRHAAEAPTALVIAVIATIVIGTAALVVAALIADVAEAQQAGPGRHGTGVLPGAGPVFPDRA